jgi:hypothetical protein
MKPLSFGALLSLYCSLKGNLSLLEWIEENKIWTVAIDVRYIVSPYFEWGHYSNHWIDDLYYLDY